VVFLPVSVGLFWDKPLHFFKGRVYSPLSLAMTPCSPLYSYAQDTAHFMMKVLVADKIAPAGVEFLRQQEGIEVVEAYGSSPEQILELVKDVHAIAVRSETKITAEVMDAAPLLKAVGRAGVGVDNIDVDAATDRGIVVMNTPTGNTIATAELTFTHMLCATRPVAQACGSMKAGNWDRKKFSGTELNGKTLAVLGMGRIGSEVAKRAQAFGMTVLAYDPYLTERRAKNLDVELATLEQAFAEADYITVHMPLTDSTKDLINADAMAKMKDGVRLINCARGGIINEKDLAEAVKSGKVAAAGMDVYVEEPLDKESELRKLDNLVLTPHLGASTKEAQESVGIEVAEALVKVLTAGEVVNAVNMPSVDARTLKTLRPYLQLGEALGTLLQQLTPSQVDKLQIAYWGKVASLDAMPLTRAIQKGYLKRISGENVNDVNAPSKIKELGIEVETVKSSEDADYTELVEVSATMPDGETISVGGSLFSRNQRPRVVSLYGRPVEFSPRGTVIILQNQDVPGIVGKLGSILGKDSVNIANLSLSRSDDPAKDTLAVYEVDSRPSDAALKEIEATEGIRKVQVIAI